MTYTQTYSVLEVVAAVIYDFEHPTNENYHEKYSNLPDIINNAPLQFERAEEMISSITANFTLRILLGKTNSNFMQKINALLSTPSAQVAWNNVNILSYVPKVYENIKLENLIREISCTSSFAGEVGKPLQVDLKILTCKLIQSDNGSFYSALAVDQSGHIFTLNPKRDLTITTDFTYRVKAKVKAHKQDPYINNAEITQLNYVKELI